ncbi:MAG: GNAT family N-acetyltransferase [Pseudobacteriovorax sp.]|nr:GNAT family N-acetyltransferase [Pseudobacteriovorax sp.]
MDLKKINDVLLVPYAKHHVPLVKEWLSRDSITKWLDMGHGKQKLNDLELRNFIINPNNKIFLYGPSEDCLVGLMCLNGITHKMGLGEVWGLRGAPGGTRDLTTFAFLKVIATGFLEFDRKVISTWVAEPNRLSHRVHENCGFKPTGRLRDAHLLDGKRCDRVLYDITYSEFEERYPLVSSILGHRFDPKANII